MGQKRLRQLFLSFFWHCRLMDYSVHFYKSTTEHFHPCSIYVALVDLSFPQSGTFIDFFFFHNIGTRML